MTTDFTYCCLNRTIRRNVCEAQDDMTFDMIVSPGLDRSPEEGSAAGADLAPVVTVFSRSLAANLMTGDEKIKYALMSTLQCVTSQIR